MPSYTSLSPADSYKKGLLYIVLVSFFLISGTLIAVAFDLDRRVGMWFFSDVEGWRFQNAWLWVMLYRYGTIPGLLLTLSALLVFTIGLFHPKWRNWRIGMLVILLTSIVGAGLLVNSILKPYCGRPRPREVVEFKGQWAFCQPCFDSEPGKGMSFPCGHCTMGFLFVTLAYCRRQSRVVAYTGIGLGMVLGGLLGVTRAAQGGHFLTDIAWSLGIILLISMLLYYWVIPFFGNSPGRRTALNQRKKVFLAASLCLLAVVVSAFFLTRRPFLENRIAMFTAPPGVEHLVVFSNVDLAKTGVEPEGGDQIRIEILGRGFAAPKARQLMGIEFHVQQHTLEVGVLVDTQGYFSELRHELQIGLPAAVHHRMTIEVHQPSGAFMPKHLPTPDGTR